MLQKQSNLSFFIMNFLLLINLIELVFPPVTIYGNAYMIRFICILGWLLFSFMNDTNFYLRSNIRMTYVLLFFALTVILPYLFNVGVIGNRYVALSMIPFGYLMFCYYKRHNRLGDLCKLVLISGFFAAITLVITLISLIKSPHISRTIKSSGEYSKGLAALGIGGYHFIYMMVVVTVLLLYVFLKDNRPIVRRIAFFCFVPSFFLIIKSSYVTALVTVFISSLILIVLNYAKKGNNRSTFLFIIIAVFASLILFNLTEIINKFADILPERIARVLVTDTENGSVYKSLYEEFAVDRWPTMLESIKTTFKYPIFGTIASSTAVSTRSVLSGVGQHSHLLDTFAFFGLFIGTINVFVMLRPFKDDNGKIIKRGKALNAAMLVCMIGILFFNNATDSIATAFGIAFPLVREIYHPEAQLYETVK